MTQRPTQKKNIVNDNKFTKNMILTLLNEIFSTSDKKNEQMIVQFAKEYEIRNG